MVTLRAAAKKFIPGAKEHIIKRFSWHPLGITEVKYFQIEEESTPCFPKGCCLIGKPASPIKGALGIQANPFLIPPDPSAVGQKKTKDKPRLVRQGPRRYNYCDN